MHQEVTHFILVLGSESNHVLECYQEIDIFITDRPPPLFFVYPNLWEKYFGAIAGLLENVGRQHLACHSSQV